MDVYNDRARSQACLSVAKESGSLSCDDSEEAGVISWEFLQIEKGLIKIWSVLPAGNVCIRPLLKFRILLRTKGLDDLIGPLGRTMPRKMAFVME